MSEERKMLDHLLAELHDLVCRNENPDGTFAFDICRAKVALEFAKTEIEKTILVQKP